MFDFLKNKKSNLTATETVINEQHQSAIDALYQRAIQQPNATTFTGTARVNPMYKPGAKVTRDLGINACTSCGHLNRIEYRYCYLCNAEITEVAETTANGGNYFVTSIGTA